MTDPAIDSYEYVIATSHGIEQFPVGQTCPPDISDCRDVEPIERGSETSWDTVVQ